jgi:transposase-like protein
MVKSKSIVSLAEVKGLLEQDGDFLRNLVQEIVQRPLEAEMEAAIGAGKGERTDSRLGYGNRTSA